MQKLLIAAILILFSSGVTMAHDRDDYRGWRDHGHGHGYAYHGPNYGYGSRYYGHRYGYGGSYGYNYGGLRYYEPYQYYYYNYPQLYLRGPNFGLNLGW